MKKINLITKCLTICVLCLISGGNLFAQRDNLVLVSGTDFSSTVTGTGTTEKTIWDINEVDGFLGIIRPTLSTSLSIATTTKTTTTKSDFLSKAQFAITNNPNALDELRMVDEDMWGFVSSTTKDRQSYLTLSVSGLKNGNNFRVEIEYFVPLTTEYVKSTQYNVSLRAIVNPDESNGTNGSSTGDLLNFNSDAGGKSGTFILDPSKPNGCQNCGNPQSSSIIDEGTLKVSISTEKGALGQPIMIKSIKVYAIPNALVSGPKTVCAGGESIILSVASSFTSDVTYQWYKKEGNSGTKLTGETGMRLKHVSGKTKDKKTTYYYIATVPDGKGGTAEVKSNEFTVTDIMCCMNEETHEPAPRKLVWQDDFGTFESAKSYWTWDYTNIADPKKVTHQASGNWVDKLPYEIPGAVYNDKTGGEAPRPEGWYRVVSFLSDQGGSSNLGWTAQAYDGQYPNKSSFALKKNGVAYFPDHTYQQDASSMGGMLQINMGCYAGDVIYSRPIKGLCDKKLTFKCFINTFSKDPTPVSVYVRATEIDNDGNPVGIPAVSDPVEKKSENDPETADWKEVQVEFELTQTRNVLVEIVSNNGDGLTGPNNSHGNDMLLDDIQIFACSAPGVDLYFNLDNYAQDTIECDENNVNLFVDVSDALDHYYGSEQYYVFQYSLKDPSSSDFKKSWVNLRKAPSKVPVMELADTLVLADLLDAGHEKVYFRVVAGSLNTIEDELKRNLNDSDNPYRFNEDDPCAEFSISKPIELTIKCPSCTPPDKDPEIYADGTSTESIHLCRYEKTLLTSNTISATTGDGDPVNYRITWHKGTKNSVAIKGGSGAQSVADELEVSWDQVDENGTMYILLTHDMYEDQEGTRKCDRADTITIYADPVPDVPTLKIPEFCEGLASQTDAVKDYINNLKSSLTGYKETIEDAEGNKYDFTDFLSRLNELKVTDNHDFTIFLTETANNTGCVSDTAPFSVTINEIPGVPSTEDLSYVMEEGKMQSLEKGATVTDGTYRLQWEPTTKGGSENLSAYRNDVPAISLSDTAEYYYYARQVSASGCEGPGKMFKVVVSTAQLPNKLDTTVCVGSAVDLKDLMFITDSQYELLWYDEGATPDGNGSPTAPNVSTDVPGKYTFYATQKSTEAPYPESKLRDVTVEVVDVYVPDTVGNKYHYCSDDTPVDLVAKLKTDESKSYYADKLMWSVDGGAESETKPTVNTNVLTTTTHEYKAYQTYTIPNSKHDVCKGKPVTWNVEVTFVPALTTTDVTYMKADAENGTFAKNVMEQSENAAITDYVSTMKLWWYEKDCSTKIGDGRTAPTPKVNPSVEVGMDQPDTFCVRQEIAGCLSEGTQVPVLISDAPKPYSNDYVYCKGDVADNLTTKPDTTTKPGVYILKWYGNGEKGDQTDLHLSGDAGPIPTTNMRGGENGKSEYYYYVTQTEIVNGQEGAESNKTEIKVTVYDQTNIAIDNSVLGAVCKPATVDIAKSVSFTNEVANLTYDTRYYADQALTDELTGTSVGESGSYYVQTSFTVTAKANSATCVSKPTAIPVTVDTLQVLVEDVGACPNESATFLVRASTNTTGVKYTWNGITESDPNGGISTNEVFTTKAFTGADYGAEFRYSLKVEAGTCSFSTEPKVTLGEGPVIGTMTVTEADNSYTPNTFTDTKFNEFYSCGGELTLLADYHDKDGNPITDYTWYDGTKELSNKAELTLGENQNWEDKTYILRFKSGCPTSVTITIHYRWIKAFAVSSEVKKLCEGKKFSTEVETRIAQGETPEYTWYRNGAEIQLGDGTSLDVNRTKLTIDKVHPKDNGRYSFLLKNRGCESRVDLDSLVAMPYIEVPSRIDTIVPRHSNPTIALDVTVPAGGAGVTYEWKGSRGEMETTNPVTLNDVTSDHYYEVRLSAEDHCDSTAIVDVKVDAKLMLKTTLKDTICTGLSAVLTIDTTGTGRFRHEDWPRSLTVTETTGGATPNDLTVSVTQDGDLLKLTVSPTTAATYEVRFIYGPQDTMSPEPLYVIPAIGVTIPEAVTICEGEATDIMITDIRPEGTVIKWNADTTIQTETLDTSTVRVKPVYLGGTNHQYQYAYDFVAYNVFCNSSVPYTAYVKVDEPLEGEILGDHVICETFSSRLDASSYAATTYVWTVEGDTVNQGASMTVTPAATTNYHLSMDRGACHKDDAFLLTVKTNPVIVDMDSVDIRNREVILKDGAGEEPFNFWVDDLVDTKTIDPVLFNLKFSKHTAHVMDKNGCVAEFLFEVPAPGLTIPPYFTPNSDGINDTWIVPELPAVYTNAVVKIYDRFGKLLAEYYGAKEDGWDGTYNGHAMPSTDYWYVIDVEEIDRQFMGHFTLLRQ